MAVRALRPAVVLITAIASISCARPFECKYLYLVPQDGLRVISALSKYGECRCFFGTTPTEYELRRSNYSVSLAIGERWYPQLMLDATDLAGRPLTLDAENVYESKNGATGQDNPIRLRGHTYRYFVRGSEIRDGMISFRVMDAANRQLGTVSLKIEVHTAWMIETDGP